MSSHQRFVALATKLIAKHGRDVELQSHIETGDDWNPTRTRTSQTVKAVNVSLRGDEIPQGLVDSVKAVYLIDSIVKPENKMNLVDGAKTYSILGSVEIKPGDQSILFRVFCGG